MLENNFENFNIEQKGCSRVGKNKKTWRTKISFNETNMLNDFHYSICNNSFSTSVNFLTDSKEVDIVSSHIWQSMSLCSKLNQIEGTRSVFKII